MGTIEAAEVMESLEAVAGGAPMSMCGFVPSHLSLMQQCQLTELLEQYWDIFSQDDEDNGQTPVLEHTIETKDPPV